MDAETFKREFLPYHRKMYAVAFRLLEDEAEAEDVVQDAYLKLWSRRDELPLLTNVEAFCMTLVKNLCFDLLRSARFVRNRQAGSVENVDCVVEDKGFEVHDEVVWVKRIIARLPDNQQRVLVLHDIQGCTFEEIGKVTGLNAINIRVLLSRARKKIREEFGKLTDYEKRRTGSIA